MLIRALQPLEGIEAMRERRRPIAGRSLDGDDHSARSAAMPDEELCSGPGKLTQALGIELAENGGDLHDGPSASSRVNARWRDPRWSRARGSASRRRPSFPGASRRRATGTSPARGRVYRR